MPHRHNPHDYIQKFRKNFSSLELQVDVVASRLHQLVCEAMRLAMRAEALSCNAARIISYGSHKQPLTLDDMLQLSFYAQLIVSTFKVKYFSICMVHTCTGKLPCPGCMGSGAALCHSVNLIWKLANRCAGLHAPEGSSCCRLLLFCSCLSVLSALLCSCCSVLSTLSLQLLLFVLQLPLFVTVLSVLLCS